MVLTRSQTKLQLEKEMIVAQKLSEVKTFVVNMTQMLNGLKETDMDERMQSIIKIFEYNNKMLQKLVDDDDNEASIKYLINYIKGMYAKCREFHRDYKNGKYKKLQYTTVYDFLQALRKCNDLITKLMIDFNKVSRVDYKINVLMDEVTPTKKKNETKHSYDLYKL